MANRMLLALVGAALTLGGCDGQSSGPLRVSAIGGDPAIVNPNLRPLDAASSAMLLATAQGLVGFDAAGQIEPGLAQSWIVSDDGLRYTFRLRRTQWENGGRVTAAQVVERLTAAASPASRNPLKPLLGAIDEIVAMTDDVLEISLVTPRPNFLQLLAQPEMAILRDDRGTGPYRGTAAGGGAVSLYLPDREEDPAEADVGTRDVLLRGGSSAVAVVRFMAGEADLVTGGNAGGLPIVRAAGPGRTTLRFDPALGLFGLSFAGDNAVVQDPTIRSALSMALDRDALVQALEVPSLAARDTLVSPGVTELAQPAAPDWSTLSLAERRNVAAAAIRTAAGAGPITLRVAMPDGPGYRLVFAHLRRDWRAIGVVAERVPADAPADLRFVDRVAQIDLATWYLRQFTCDQSRICNPAADALLTDARLAPSTEQRQALLAEADRILTGDNVFIPIANPVRWSLVSPRLTGFAPNPFAHHNVGELIAQRQ